MDFDIPIGKNGDCYDRTCAASKRCVKSDKHHEAVHRQTARNAAGGRRSRQATARFVPPKRDEMKRSMEALIHHFKLYTEGYHVPAGEVYAAVEAPEGRIWRLSRVGWHEQAVSLQASRAPGFAHLQCDGFSCASGHIACGHIRDPRVRSDIVFGEVDR